MILDNAIKKYTDDAEYERTHGNLERCRDFRKIVSWLIELKSYREHDEYETIKIKLENAEDTIEVLKQELKAVRWELKCEKESKNE